MKRLVLKVAFCAGLLCAGVAYADQPIGGARFGALVTGRTLSWGDGSNLYGQEQYLPDGRVKWLVADGSCKLGHWWEEAPGLICFAYDDGGAPACWRFFEGAAGLKAQSAEDSTGFLWSEIGNSDQPLACTGPMVGV
ncbi:hypothetical protein [Fuscibacter oryzae]|uniref:Uncharacterized protein n=1 Tax=Fuscibacter oryzae TaxID=2803939 RepID=A0A8J7MS97_9RHOB|nr:hypothetical protein [Fuscibacter oryzae]MBL4928702.1 hypothetical protein [Fuscibacter oryzae]